METWLDAWSLVVILGSAFVIGWAAETAQVFMSRALALSLLAWLQTLPEFAVEATIAWQQKQDLMIANLTGSLRLLVGLGWPMIFFVHFWAKRTKVKKWTTVIHLEKEDSLGVLFLFVSILYFAVILMKGSLNLIDSAFLAVIYFFYLYLAMRYDSHEQEELDDLPWVGRQILKTKTPYREGWVIGLFIAGGIALYFSAHPFVDTLERWALRAGIPAFVFVQWIAPFLSEFPEKVSAFNWARQTNKAPLALMNMVNSNINQWTMLAAMIPCVYNLSLGSFQPIYFDSYHAWELALTISQSLLGGLLLLDLKFGLWEAFFILVLWAIQFFESFLRSHLGFLPSPIRFLMSHQGVTYLYFGWSFAVVLQLYLKYLRSGRLPQALDYFLSQRKRV